MITNIQKWGNSQGVRIPKALLDMINWNKNDQLNMTVENNKIVIEKVKQRKTIKELFEDFDGDYECIDADWGEPVGKEIW